MCRSLLLPSFALLGSGGCSSPTPTQRMPVASKKALELRGRSGGGVVRLGMPLRGVCEDVVSLGVGGGAARASAVDDCCVTDWT